jgi:D-alanyl-D-alanine carboxypeptidase (penicillin-binding protein 5/6)
MEGELRIRLGRHILLVGLVVLTLIFTTLSPQSLQATEQPALPTTHAQAYSVIDVTSGRILTEYQGNKRMRIASLTKVMTAIVAIEQGELSDRVTVSSKAYGKEGSSIYLQLGEEMSLHSMLYGLMLRSGNDAATAIAEHVGGSVEGFVYMMNEKARWLGLEQTLFQNPHGLDDEQHYSSANDLARLTAYALHNAIFREIVATKWKQVPNPNKPWDYRWTNKNKMLSLYEGADGVKTGYTKQAHRTLISSATRGGQQVAVVTLDDGDDWLDHRKLLDYAFANFPLTPIVKREERVHPPNLAVGSSFAYPLGKDELGSLRKKIELEPEGTTNYKLGSRGTLKIYLHGQQIASLPLFEEGHPRLKLSEKHVWNAIRNNLEGPARLIEFFRQFWRNLFANPMGEAQMGEGKSAW